MDDLFISCILFGVHSQIFWDIVTLVPGWRHNSFHESVLDRLSAAEVLREVSHLLNSLCR